MLYIFHEHYRKIDREIERKGKRERERERKKRWRDREEERERGAQREKEIEGQRQTERGGVESGSVVTLMQCSLMSSIKMFSTIV